jgi:hypothetical protein
MQQPSPHPILRDQEIAAELIMAGVIGPAVPSNTNGVTTPASRNGSRDPARDGWHLEFEEVE